MMKIKYRATRKKLPEMTVKNENQTRKELPNLPLLEIQQFVPYSDKYGAILLQKKKSIEGRLSLFLHKIKLKALHFHFQIVFHVLRFL